MTNHLRRCRFVLSTVVAFSGIGITHAQASDTYVVRFLTPAPSGCPEVAYRDHLIFHNISAADLTVRALGGSNGYQPPSDPLVVPAGKTRSLTIVPFGLGGLFNQWAPMAPSVFMVNKLDVPDGIVVESRGEIYGRGLDLFCSPFGAGTEIFGEFQLPVVRTRTSPNAPQVHLGSELGTVASRTNVGVYNGGTANATALVEVRAACDDRLLNSRTATVPAMSVIYVTGFDGTFAGTTCLGGGNASDYVRYVVVTMDQPGFSFVLTRANVAPPALPVTSSVSR